MTMVLSRNPKERDVLTSFRMTSESLGILLGVAGFGYIISNYRVVTKIQEAATTNATLEISLQDKKNEAWGYMIGAAATSLICSLAALICFLGSREVKTTIKPPSASTRDEISLEEGTIKDSEAASVDAAPGKLTFWMASKMVLTYKPYLLHMGAFLFLSLAIQFIQSNLTLYVTHALEMSKHLINGIMVLLVLTVLLVPVNHLILRRLGKKTTMAMGICNAFPLLVAIYFLPVKPPLYVFYGMMCLASFTISIAMLLPWSMLPDVLLAFELEYGKRLDSIFYSLIVFFNKFAVGIVLSISAYVLGLAGYDENIKDGPQPPQVAQALRLLSSAGAAILLAPALVCLYFYPLSTKVVDEMARKVKELSVSSESEESAVVSRMD